MEILVVEVQVGQLIIHADNYVVFDGSTARLKFLNTSPVTEFKTTDAILTGGKTYKLIVDIASVTSGMVKVDGNGISELFNTAGINTRIIQPTGNGSLGFYRATANVDLTFNSVSVKEVTRDNVPRIDYTGGGCPHILAEPQRTNLITYSEDFTPWNKLAAVVTTNQTTSPSGTLTADKITYDGTTYGRVEQTVAVTNGNTYSWSVYLKNNDLSDVTQVWLGFSLGGQGEFVTITNEWQRYETVQVANGSNEYPRVQFTGTGSLYAWGAQLEESYATSYIPTSGSTVTRNQDIFTRDGIGSLIGQTEGTFFIELSKPVLEPDSYYLISLNNAASNSDDNSVTIGFDNNSDDFYIRVRANASSPFTDNDRASLANTFYKIAVSYKSGQSLIYIDGNPITPNSGNLSTAFTFSATLDNLSFDYNGNNSLPFFGKVKQLQVYTTALTDAQLTSLTS